MSFLAEACAIGIYRRRLLNTFLDGLEKHRFHSHVALRGMTCFPRPDFTNK